MENDKNETVNEEMFDDSSEDNSESSDNEDEQVDIYNDCKEGGDIRLLITLVLKV